MKRVAYYGGSFDPVHRGHFAVAHALLEQFELDEFVFVPAFHAPHKTRKKPTSAYDRYAMLCLITNDDPRIRVSRLEIEAPEKPYSVETLSRLAREYPNDEIFFVMGADSWMEITEWREWQKVLSLTHHIVVTRPGIDIEVDHVTEDIRQRIVDLRDGKRPDKTAGKTIFISDAVSLEISATAIRGRIRGGDRGWRDDVPVEVANYIEKYQIYS